MEQVQTLSQIHAHLQIHAFREAVTQRQFELVSFSETALRYEQAKARLLAAQQEKMEATAELMALRASLSAFLEDVWPGRSE